MAMARLDPKVSATLKPSNPPPVETGGALARVDQKVAANLDVAAPPARRRQTKEAGIAQLARCRVLMDAVDYAAKVIAGAGARLERGAVKFGEATVMQQRMARAAERATEGQTPSSPASGSSDVQLMHASLGLIDATGNVGSTLSTLGSMLNSEILTPLQKLYAQIEQDQDRRRAGLQVLEQQEQLCSNALAESTKRKDKACRHLQVALGEIEDNASNYSKTGWLKKSIFSKKDMKVEQLAQIQTSAVEELAIRTEEANNAHLRRQEGADSFHEMLCQADALYKRLLQTVLDNCARLWKDSSRAMLGMSDQLQTSASALALNIAGGNPKEGIKNSEAGEAQIEQDVADAAERAPQASSADPVVNSSVAEQDLGVALPSAEPLLPALTTGALSSPLAESPAKRAVEAEEAAVRKVLGADAPEAQPDLQPVLSSDKPVDAVDEVTAASACVASTITPEEAKPLAAGSNDGATTCVDASAEMQALLSTIPDSMSEVSASVAEITDSGNAFIENTDSVNTFVGNNVTDISAAAEVTCHANEGNDGSTAASATFAPASESAAAAVVAAAGFTEDAAAEEGQDECDTFEDAEEAEDAEVKASEAAVGDSTSSVAPPPDSTAAVTEVSSPPPVAGDASSPKRLNRLLNVSIESSQGPLGMKLTWPPNPVQVQEVVPGGWAASVGILAGSQMVLLDGLPVAEMDEAALRVALQVRPLCLAVRLPPDGELPDRV